MNKLMNEIYNNIEIGIVVLDYNLDVLLWNTWAESASNTKEISVIGKKIDLIMPIFKKSSYMNILSSCINNGESRFCSSILHKGFLYPKGFNIKKSKLRQNMQITPLVHNEKNYVLLQIFDLSSQTERVNQLKYVIKELEGEKENLKKQYGSLEGSDDKLTKLLSNLTFTQYLNKELLLSSNSNRKVCVLHIRIKSMDELALELTEDSQRDLIIEIANKLKNISEFKNVIHRRNRDFIVFLSDIIDLDWLSNYIKMLSNKLTFTLTVVTNEFLITPIIGAALYPDDSKRSLDLIKMASLACYNKKINLEGIHYYNKFITNLANVKIELAESKNRYRILFENIKEGFSYNKAIFDKNNTLMDFIILDANVSFAKLLKTTKEEIIGKKITEVTSFNITEEPEWEDFFNKAIMSKTVTKREASYIKLLKIWISVSVYNLGHGIFAIIVTDITARIKSEELIRQLAYYDKLTSLPNRRMFFEKLKILFNKSTIENTKFAVIYIDLDNFKMINDKLGHNKGDEVLKIASNIFKNSIRENDMVARIGGDEFVIIQKFIVDINDVRNLVKRIFNKFKIDYEYGIETIAVTCSLGIAIYPDDSNNCDDLLKIADFSMYQAKKHHMNKAIFFSENNS